MSTLFIEVSPLSNLRPHPQADALELSNVKGWQICVQKGVYSEGQAVIYFPPDTMLPPEVSDRLGVTKYLSKGRVRAIKLRGEPSFGFVIPAGADDRLGDNLAEAYGATKFEPPANQVEDAEQDDALFPRYTDIEHLRQFPDLIAEGEEVVVTEKLHGTNCGVGFVKELRDGVDTMIAMARSHGLRRKMPEDLSRSRYWFPWTLEPVSNLLAAIAGAHKSATLFGEVIGVQKGFDYDTQGQVKFRAFDLLVDGKYIDYADFKMLTELYGVETVPVLFRGPFSFDKIAEMAEGTSVLGGNIREGVVIKPVVERYDPRVGRIILKYLSTKYMLRADENREKGVAEIAH